MRGFGSWLVRGGVGLMVAGLMGAPLCAQTIQLDKVNMTFGGTDYEFLPGADNRLEIPPPPDFNLRRADLSFTTSFSGPAGVPFIVSCGVVFNAGLAIDRQIGASAVPNGTSGAGLELHSDGMQLVERITHTYDFFCELDRTTSPFGVIVESEHIQVQQEYTGEDSLSLTNTIPDPAVRLEPGSWVQFEGTIEYMLGSRGPQGRIHVTVKDSAGGVLVETSRVVPTTASAQTLEWQTPIVQVPATGRLTLEAVLQFQRGSKFGGLPGDWLERLDSAWVAYRTNIPVDFTIDHIEVVQTVQDEVNSVPLVAGKAVMVRVFAKKVDDGHGARRDVPLLLKGQLPGGEVLEASDAGRDTKVSPSLVRYTLRRSYNFIFPAEVAREGNVTFEAVVNPEGTVEEADTSNNSKQVTVRFEPRRGISIRYLPVCIQPPGQAKTCPGSELGDLGEIASRLFPVARGKFSYDRLEGPELIWPEIPNTKTKRQALFHRLERIFTSTVAHADGLIEFDQLAAWLPDKVGEEPTLGRLAGEAAPKWAGQLGRVTINKDKSAVAGWFTQNLLAHEIGHNLGLRHPKNDPCGARDPDSRWPIPGDSTIQEQGADPIAAEMKVGKPRVFQRTKKDLMSYCDPADSIWISPFHYRQLYGGEFLPQGEPATAGLGVRAATSGEFAFVSGLASRDGVTAEVDPIQRFSGTAAPSVPEAGGEYCIRFADSGGGKLSEHCFALSFRSAESGEKMDEQGFTQLVQWPAGTTSVSLLRLGAVLDTITASAGKPQVQVTAPAAGERWEGTQERTVSWAGNDPDGDALLYSLLYSSSGGQTWTALAVELTDTQFTFDPAKIRGGADVRFQVTATDGFHQGSATAGPITVVQQPQIAVDAQPVELGEAVVGDSVTGAVALRNSGTGPLTVASITSDSERFEIVSPFPLSVAAGATRKVLVRYTAGAQSAEAGTLTIRSDATDQPELAVAVQGMGTDGQTPRIRLAAETLRFFGVAAGDVQSGVFTFENRSLVDLEVEWTFAGADVFAAEAEDANFTVEAGADGLIKVTFAPPAVGEFTGTLTINTNDPDRATVVVPVIGNAVEALPPSPAPAFGMASIVSAADFSGERFAAEMWVALFGENLADKLVIATGGLPTSLGGTSVAVTDSAGTRHAAKLQFVAPGQINFLLPAGTANGTAVIEVTNADGETNAATIAVETVAPSVFSANSRGVGAAAATYLRVDGDGNRSEGLTFDANTKANVTIGLSPATDQVYLNFFGTGFRAQSSVSAKIGGVAVPVLAAIAQGQFEGLDQAAVGPLPPDLAGRGEVNVEFLFDGLATNAVTVRVE